MTKAVLYLIPVSLLSIAGAYAQAANSLANGLTNFGGASWEGIHLYGVGAFTTYVSSAYPFNTNVITPGATSLGYDINWGASVSGGWQFHRAEKFDAAVDYIGTYNRSENFRNLSAFGHSLRANASWQITPRWTFAVSGTAIYQTLAEYLFQPNGVSAAVQAPVDINSLASAMGAGQVTNSQTAAMLTGTLNTAVVSPQADPATSLLVGNRIFSYAGQATMTYQATSRLAFNVSGVTAAGQNRTGGTSGTPVQTYVMPHSIGINGGGSMDYSLSPRTTLGLGVSGGRISNRYQNAYTGMAEASLGRMMGEHWFMRVAGGGSYTSTIQQQYGSPITRQFIGSGSLGYSLQSHTFVAVYNRSSTDSTGFSVGTNDSGVGTWLWRRPGSRWTIMASGGHQRVTNTGFSDLEGWHGSMGFRTVLEGNVMMAVEYVYAKSSGTYIQRTTDISVNSIRLTIGWAPAAMHIPQTGGSTPLESR